MPRLALRQYSFYYRVNGEKAEQLLRDYGQDGHYLVRFSESNPQNFSISVRVADSRILHIKVTKFPDDSLSIFEDERTASITFDSITELVEYYMEFPERLREKNGLYLELKRPIFIPYQFELCAEEQRITQLHRWWHGNLPATSANKILHNEKNGSYLVRASQHIPGALVISAKTDGNVVHLTIYQDPFTGKFNIDGDRTKFSNVWLLLDSYAKNPIVEKGETSRVVYLETPIFDTFIEADLLCDRYELLSKPINARESSEKTGISEEFDRLSSEALPSEQYLSKRAGRRSMNTEKNRYKNILPFDHTRVTLKNGPSGSDYINASYVRFENTQRTKNVTFACEKSFIATQGCLETTIADFWWMVWQENSRVIVMPTMANERKSKCARYWPAEVGKAERHGEIFVTCTIERKIKRHVSEEIRIELTSEKGKRENKDLPPEPELDGDGISYTLRTLVIKKGDQTREIRQLQYLTWPDHGCPAHPYAVLDFLEDVDREYDYFNAQPIAATLPQGPIVVHCSAGIGRTGTILVLDALLTQVKKIGLLCPVDVYRMVKYVRTYRSGLVQTEQQYQFLYKALAFYLKKNNPYPVKSFVVNENANNDAAEAAAPSSSSPPNQSPRRLRSHRAVEPRLSASQQPPVHPAMSRPTSAASSSRATTTPLPRPRIVDQSLERNGHSKSDWNAPVDRNGSSTTERNGLFSSSDRNGPTTLERNSKPSIMERSLLATSSFSSLLKSKKKKK